MKKRLMTTAILTLVISLFFCASVFAETVIQGTSDTVTATYGSEDITIALKARKLRVINTGTAAAGYAGYTPVIVTVTIYNLGNQNCLINNLKFQLYSDSAEYTIAGFENLSTDLFLADSVYDTDGYLSIHASNDYTYSGGIVCPANTNMTYVGIINVSANWISDNQTWRTVDLSRADFYSNMSTTVGDYACTSEPVDLSAIENLMEDLVQTVEGIDLDSSTYLPLLQDIVDVNSYTGAGPADINVNKKYDRIDENNYLISGHRLIVERYVGRPFYTQRTVIENTTNDTLIDYGTVRYPFVVRVLNNNSNSYPLQTYYFNRIDGMLPGNVSGNVYVSSFYSDVYKYFSFNRNGDLLLNASVQSSSVHGVIPVGSNMTVITGYLEVPANVAVTFANMDVTNYSPYTSLIQLTTGYYPKDEYTILRDIYLALNPSETTNDPEDVETESQSINNAVENIQTAEAQYFADNQEAIENTGLSNFHFNDNQVWSLTMIVDQFEAVWNALGEFTVVYIFTLMMSLATYLIRHEPTTKVKQWRESVSAERAERTSYYGRKNAEARAHDSTMKKAIRRR